MLDYAVIVPRLQRLYEWSAEELAEPRLLELIRDGNPIYAWPFEERHDGALGTCRSWPVHLHVSRAHRGRRARSEPEWCTDVASGPEPLGFETLPGVTIGRAHGPRWRQRPRNRQPMTPA